MYIEKDVKRGYNAYLSIEQNNGEGSYMDVGLLLMEAGDEYDFYEKDKELSFILMKGAAELVYDGQVVSMDRPDPFAHNPYCLLMAKGHKAKLRAGKKSEFYVQKTFNERDYETHLYTPEETDTWTRGKGELDNMMLRDVRTCYDYESRPDSNMVLGEVCNLPGRWSSYPPHHHPQPEVYFYFFEKEQGFGAGWQGGEPHEIHNHGCLVINDDRNHHQVMAPGYACCYTWGIRHLPGNPWEKTRIDDETHVWLLDHPSYWHGPTD